MGLTLPQATQVRCGICFNEGELIVFTLLIIDFPFAAPLIGVDYSVAHVGQETFTVGLFFLEDGSGVLQIIATESCTLVEPVVLARG